MGKSKRKKGPRNDIIALPGVASQQKKQPLNVPVVANTITNLTTSTRERGKGSELSSPGPKSSQGKAFHRGTGGSNSDHQLPTITRGPEAIRRLHHYSSPQQRTPGNEATVSKIEYLSKIATWAAAKVPSLGAFYGERLASTCQSGGIISPVLNTQCERCECVLLPGVNCSVRVAPNKKARKKKLRKLKAGEALETVNMVVYQCQYCKYENNKPGTSKQHVKTKLAEEAARAQMKELASTSSSKPSATIGPGSPTQGVVISSVGGDLSTTPGTPVVSSPAVVSPASALHVDLSSSKKRKRKGWTGLKAIATSLQNRELSTIEQLGSAEDFTSPLNPRKKGSV